NDQEKEDDNVNNTNNVNTASDGNSTNNVNAVSSTVNAAGIEVNVVGAKTCIELLDDPNMPELEDIVYSDDDEDVGTEADMNNLDAFMHEEPKKVVRALKDTSWIETMQEELLQFKLQEVWALVELPNGKRAIETKWVFRNKKIEASRLLLAYASFKDFVVYQMDIKSAFLYGKIKEEVYVCQPPGFEDPD
ncbi:putative ribonuclease H-like domain-containing protein, partial [Tanacetum coccineum]